MKSKYNGIDEREICCSCTNPNCIESGISFEVDSNGTHLLRFHYLSYVPGTKKLHQYTKNMHLDSANTHLLIEHLQGLEFDNEQSTIVVAYIIFKGKQMQGGLEVAKGETPTREELEEISQGIKQRYAEKLGCNVEDFIIRFETQKQ